MTGLDDAPGGRPNQFRATDYETLVDSPIVAGKLGIRTFDVAGKKHFVVSAGDTDGWDGDRAARDLRTFVEENHRFWGFLPYEKYVFLLLFRPGGGGLEHRNSNLSTVRGEASAARRGAPAPPDARWPSLGLEAHEYFHLFNVKRLRPIELGPFDFEKPPTTGSLWIAEGVTSYYSGLLMTRAGLQTPDEYLASLSSAHRQAADFARPPAAVGGAFVARGVGEQQLGRQSRRQRPSATTTRATCSACCSTRRSGARPTGARARRCRSGWRISGTAEREGSRPTSFGRRPRRWPAPICGSGSQRGLIDRRARLHRPARVVRAPVRQTPAGGWSLDPRAAAGSDGRAAAASGGLVETVMSRSEQRARFIGPTNTSVTGMRRFGSSSSSRPS